MNISNKLCFHYQHILRSDLLLKLNYSNIMEIPRVTKVIILSQVPYESIKQVSLALEIISGQKLIQKESSLLQLNPTAVTRRIKHTFDVSSTQKNTSTKKQARQLTSNYSSSTRKERKKGSKTNSRTEFNSYNTQFQKETDYLVRCCLRLEIMYHFLEKLITILCFHDYKTQIQANTIQLTLKANLLRLFPEIQHYIELFETVQNVQVIIFTSARTEKETRLLWTGFLQK
jgi:ribosomal protein L5